MGRHKKVIETELSDFEANFSEDKEKESPSLLAGKHIKQFNGETYNGSMSLAFDWLNSINDDDRYAVSVELVDYFKQEHCHKAILVSYNTKPKVTSEDTN